jgi:hypothetical protein
MEQGSCLNEDADISSVTEVNLSVPGNLLSTGRLFSLYLADHGYFGQAALLRCRISTIKPPSTSCFL